MKIGGNSGFPVKNMKAAERIFKEAARDIKDVQIRGETYAFDDNDHVVSLLDELNLRLDNEQLIIEDSSTCIFDEKRIAKDING